MVRLLTAHDHPIGFNVSIFSDGGFAVGHFLPIRTYFQTDTRVFMGESFPPLKRSPEY
jgi:hypothetical protein